MKGKMLWVVALILVAGLVLSACAPKSQAPAKVKASVVEKIAGSEFNRVTLTEMAAKRLGIKTEPVRVEQVQRTYVLVGEVMAWKILPVTGGSDVPGSTNSLAPGEVFIRLRLNESDREKVDRDQTALVVSINHDNGEDIDAGSLEADAFEDTSIDDEEDSDANGSTLYFKFSRTDHALIPGEIVWVEVALKSAGSPQKVIPYAALLYDLHGKTFVYTNPDPLVYIRQPVTVDYIDDDEAVLVDGPSEGTRVVTVGVAELYGTDTGVGK